MAPEMLHVAISVVTPEGPAVYFMCVVVNDSHGIDIVPTDAYIQAEISKASASWPGVTVTSWRRIPTTEVQAVDRKYRNALYDENSALKHNMPKARELHRTHIRKYRALRFAALDGQWMKATGQGAKAEAAKVEAERQRLRDLPQDPRIEAAQTTEELKALWPAELS